MEVDSYVSILRMSRGICLALSVTILISQFGIAGMRVVAGNHIQEWPPRM
jgi:hypothetical protein